MVFLLAVKSLKFNCPHNYTAVYSLFVTHSLQVTWINKGRGLYNTPMNFINNANVFAWICKIVACGGTNYTILLERTYSIYISIQDRKFSLILLYLKGCTVVQKHNLPIEIHKITAIIAVYRNV